MNKYLGVFSFLISGQVLACSPMERLSTKEMIVQSEAIVIGTVIGFSDKNDESYAFFEINRRIFYVNCWRIANNESEAMWKLYCGEEINNGVVIKSTVAKLKSELQKNSLFNLHVGKVKYLEKFYWPETTISPEILFYKRDSFEHEKEFRAVFQEEDQSKAYDEPLEEGKSVKVDIDALIEEVRFSPFYDFTSYEPEFREKTKKYNFKKYKSIIEAEPPITTSFKLNFKGKPHNPEDLRQYKEIKNTNQESEIILEKGSPFELGIKRFNEEFMTDIDLNIKLRSDIAEKEKIKEKEK
jgi:hypothetical protein